MQITEILEKSILVVAHPDDEILWFSSIADTIQEIVICFIDYTPEPELSMGRWKSLSAYPLKRLSPLGIEEAGTYGFKDWQNPIATKFGLALSDKNISEKYEENFYQVKENLRNKLVGYSHVFTHNPWGEYGHADHVQIYRVVTDLQADMKFTLWFSNYCSNMSFNFMRQHIPGFYSEYITLKTNELLGNQIANLYKQYGCWTWSPDWLWFKEESFMKETHDVQSNSQNFPLNLITVKLLNKKGDKATYCPPKFLECGCRIGRVFWTFTC